jgi:Tol biopolymer transport system component
MGEVYRARDDRIGREVAVKVLAAQLSTDPLMLRRFFQEVRAIGALNHPNILQVYDTGSQDGAPYIVSELLEGETLRSRLVQGSLPVRKVLDYTIQIADGLAAAHEKGIVHRDLKPENLFLTRDGRVKILDFGLAKLREPAASLLSDDGTTGALQAASPAAREAHEKTSPGAVLGTVGYMSPEQVRGQPVDERSDIFTFGSIFYEMLSGRRAFRGDSAVETMHAILRDDPPEPIQAEEALPVALEQILRRCLEKSPGERFHSARDLAFALRAFVALPSQPRGVSGVRSALRPRRPLPARAAVTVALLAAAAAAFALGSWRGRREGVWSAAFQRLTFRRGFVLSARFTPDGQNVVYGASWEGMPAATFLTRPGATESRLLVEGAELLSVSASDALAVSQGHRYHFSTVPLGGTLAQGSLAGGAVRVLLDDVVGADWSPDGKSLAVIRRVGPQSRLEYPVGSALYTTERPLAYPRVSPDGSRVAFVEFADAMRSRGRVMSRGPGGAAVLAEGLLRPRSLAWAKDTGEVWYTAFAGQGSTVLEAVTPAGARRIVARLPGWGTVLDVASGGRALVSRETITVGLRVATAGRTGERDLSWLDASHVSDISRDGGTVLFSEMGEGGGDRFGVYVRRTDGSPAVRLGDGLGWSLSPDGHWVLGFDPASSRLKALPTGAGEERLVGSPRAYRWARWHPRGAGLLFAAAGETEAPRVYWQSSLDANPRALTPPGVSAWDVSPDGRLLAAVQDDGKAVCYPLDGGQTWTIPGLSDVDLLVGWSDDARHIYVRPRSEGSSSRVEKVDVESGRREQWREITPPDTTGLLGPVSIVIAPDGRSYAYNFMRVLSDLYLVTGLR